MAYRPPRFDELPATIVVPEKVDGAQSLKPGLTANFSTGLVRRAVTGGDAGCDNAVVAQRMTAAAVAS